MPLKRLILLLSLLVVATFIAGAVIYHTTVFFHRLASANAVAERELERTAQRLTHEMLNWQRFARAVSIALPEADDAEAAVARLARLVEQTYGLRGVALVDDSGAPLWRVGAPIAPAAAGCGGEGGARSVVSAPAASAAGLIHCLPVDGPGGPARTLVLSTRLDTLDTQMPASALLSTMLVDGSGRVLAGGELHGVERYPMGAERRPLAGPVHLSGQDFQAASVPVTGLGGAHLVALTSHRTVWSRVLEPLLAPAGVIYLLMAAVLAVLVRKLYVAAERDVQRREKVEQQLHRNEALYRELSVSDSLTGLYNRRKFHADLRHEVSRIQRYDRPLSLAVLDVDCFKQINDRHGHNEGDRVLRLIGRVLRSTRRKTDTAYRVGGEEFVLMLPETGAADAVNVVQRLQAALAESCLYTEAGEPIRITVSAGIAEFDGQESDQALFNRADAAMYAVKQRGRGGLAVADRTPAPALAEQGESG